MITHFDNSSDNFKLWWCLYKRFETTFLWAKRSMFTQTAICAGSASIEGPCEHCIWSSHGGHSIPASDAMLFGGIGRPVGKQTPRMSNGGSGRRVMVVVSLTLGRNGTATGVEMCLQKIIEGAVSWINKQWKGRAAISPVNMNLRK